MAHAFLAPPPRPMTVNTKHLASAKWLLFVTHELLRQQPTWRLNFPATLEETLKNVYLFIVDEVRYIQREVLRLERMDLLWGLGRQLHTAYKDDLFGALRTFEQSGLSAARAKFKPLLANCREMFAEMMDRQIDLEERQEIDFRRFEQRNREREFQSIEKPTEIQLKLMMARIFFISAFFCYYDNLALAKLECFAFLSDLYECWEIKNSIEIAMDFVTGDYKRLQRVPEGFICNKLLSVFNSLLLETQPQGWTDKEHKDLNEQLPKIDILAEYSSYWKTSGDVEKRKLTDYWEWLPSTYWLMDEQLELTMAMVFDGMWLFTANTNKTIQVFDANKHSFPPTPVMALEEHEAWVYDVKAWQSILYTAGADNLIRLYIQDEPRVWDVWYELRGHIATVMSLALYPPGKWLFSSSADRTIRVWSMDVAQPENQKAKPQCVHVLDKHSAQVCKLEIGCGKLFSASYDGTVRVWQLNVTMATEIECTQVLSDHKGEVYTLHTKGNFLFSGGLDKTVRVWDISGDQVVQVACLREHNSFILSLTSSDSCLFSCGGDRHLVIWKLGSWMHERTLVCRHEGYRCIEYRDGLLWMASYDETLTALGPLHWWM